MKRILFMALIALSAAGNAQLAPGRSGSTTDRYITGQQAWDELASFGACYASKERENALKLVSTPAGTVDEAKVYKQLFKDADLECLGDLSSMSVPWQYVRGAVAEGFYTKGIPVPSNLAVTAPMKRENVQNFSDMAVCYVGSHAAQARALIEGTKMGSKQHMATLGAMFDDLAQCVPGNADARPEVDLMILRFRIAEALWRMGMVKGQPGSGAGAAK